MGATQQAIDPITGRKVYDADGNPMPFKPRFDMDNPLTQMLDANLRKIPTVKSLNVLANRANKNLLETVDFLGTDVINEILSLSGSSVELPSLSKTAQEKLGVGMDLQGNYDAVLGKNSEGLGRTLELTSDVGQMAIPGGPAVRTVANANLARVVDDVAKYTESAGQGVLRQMGQGTSARDLAEGAGTGFALGMVEQVTDHPVATTLTEFIAPMLVPSVSGRQISGALVNATKFLDTMFSGPAPFGAGMENLSSYSTEGAVKILGDAMLRSGKSVDEIMARYDELYAQNPETIPADVDDTFRQYLRALGNKVPTVMGQSRSVLNTRNERQYDRIAQSLDSTFDSSFGVPGLNAQDEITRLQTATRQEISAKYAQAKAEGFGSTRSSSDQVEMDLRESPLMLHDRMLRPIDSSGNIIRRSSPSGNEEVGGVYTVFSPKMNARMEVGVAEPKTSLGQARQAAEQYIQDEVGAGNSVTHFDVIDFTKKQMDDMIGVALRNGELNKARQLTQQKNLLVKDADELYPSYAEARQMYAERAQLESAEELGRLFTKGGQNRLRPNDIKHYVDTLGEAELRMFRLGAKNALIERMEDASLSADQMRSIYRSRAEREKLRALFQGSGKQEDAVGRIQYEDFMKYLETEVEFRLTRKAAQENSTTPMQLETGTTIDEAIANVGAALESPTRALPKMIESFMATRGKATAEQARIEAMKTAGDVLLLGGMNPVRLQSMLRAGADEAVKRELIKLYYKDSPSKVAALRNASFGELALHFRDQAEFRENQEELQSQLPN